MELGIPTMLNHQHVPTSLAVCYVTWDTQPVACHLPRKRKRQKMHVRKRVRNGSSARLSDCSLSASIPICSFGLVADIQAASKPDGGGEGRVQRYAAATEKLGAAIDAWLHDLRRRRTRISSPPLCCVLSLGDIVDGREDEARTAEDLEAVLAHWRRLPPSCPAVHVVGNHCLKFLPRARLERALQIPASYYRHELADGWALLVLDTTDLSMHGGWTEGSDRAREAAAFAAAHAGETRMQPYNGGLGSAQLRWLDAQLEHARAKGDRLIVASHHAFAKGACRETHRSWTGDEVAAKLECASDVVVLALAGHDHLGGCVVANGLAYVTLEALLEAPVDGNAFGIVHVYEDHIAIDGCGTSVRARTLPIR